MRKGVACYMIFERLTDTVKRIEEIKENIIFLEMRACAPKSGEITGMPKDGGNASNPIETYLEKKEELEEKLALLSERLKSQWRKAVHLMRLSNVNEQSEYMMYLRFYKGLPWKQCTLRLKAKYPDGKWNENKCFREYRNTLIRVRRAQRQSECS